MTIELETTGPGAVDPRAEQHMVPMRDGVSLAIDVYLPEAAAPCAAVLVRLPYDKNGRYCWMPQIARHFTGRGYVFLVQDVRGKFRSGGEVNAFVHELDDGYDTLEWVTRQPWSNGAVGMWGDSYYGFTQWTAVASGHPALRAIVPRVTVADLFEWLDGVTPLYGAHYLAQYWSDGLSHHWTPDWTRRPLCELFDDAFEVIGSRSIAFDRLLAEARGRRASSCMPPATRSTGCGSRPCTALAGSTTSPRRTCSTTSGSWPTPPRRRTSTSTPGRPTTRTSGSRTSRSPSRRPRQARRRAPGDAPRYLQPALDFFDAFLAGRSDPQSVARVRWHLGNDGWRTSPCWPPPGAVERRLHLSPQGQLRRAGGGRPGRPGCTTRGPGPVDDREPFSFLSNTRTRARSPPARTSSSSPATPRAPLTLAGRVVAHLWVGSDGPSMSST